MTDATTHPGWKALAEIMAMEGVTPGPWRYCDGYLGPRVLSPQKEVCSDFFRFADARYTAATNPAAMADIAALVAALDARIAELEAENERLRTQIAAEKSDAIAARKATSTSFAAGRKAGFDEAAMACDEIDNSCGMEAGLAAHCAKYIRALAREGE